MWILIPSYEPDARLVALIRDLHGNAPVLVVDDGSGPAYADVFDAAAANGAVVLHHAANLGKAGALRTGFAWIERHAPGHTVVCADSDGQHTPDDIRAVGAEAARRIAAGKDDALVLGARAFVGTVPLRSRLGNRVTSAVVGAVTGRRIADTQTGLRAIPHGLVPWVRGVRGERFAYELRVLLEATRQGVPMVEVPIATVYLDGNASSHFRPLVDSLRVLTPVAAFAASSLISFALDTVALVALDSATGSLAVAVVGARVLSAGVNFALNRRAVFRAGGPVLPQLWRYAALAGTVLVAGWGSLAFLTGLGLPLVAAKVITDVTLFAASYGAQRALVFHDRRARSHPASALLEALETTPHAPDSHARPA